MQSPAINQRLPGLEEVGMTVVSRVDDFTGHVLALKIFLI